MPIEGSSEIGVTGYETRVTIKTNIKLPFIPAEAGIKASNNKDFHFELRPLA